ncbi:MAG: histidine phosphatase family protein [Chitinophagaceae bacterium]|nr:histidine phosphatase family protein [Chitinophagaceae bacterium]
MKYVLVFLAVFGCWQIVFGQAETGVTKIFIVRHAEKETGKDPVLTAAGNARAGDLMRRLKDENIQKIYVSQFRRTQNTADSLRIRLNIDTVHYSADTLCDNLVNTIMEHRDFGKTILIVAHSNTIPQIIRKFGVPDYPYGDLADQNYDSLFLITYKQEKARLQKMKFGKASGVSAAMK